MPRIAVLGANGQVGAELCLLLSKIPQIGLVPICRNPTGSAFLRHSGIACRHGRIADPKEAQLLIGDCDVILNCALGAGTPRDIREFDEALLRNVFTHSPPGAIVIHCSTLMVHGDPRPSVSIRSRDAYGRAKLSAERWVRKNSRRTGKPAYTLRLGHVCGLLQNITAKIRSEVLDGSAILFEKDKPSNTVYTVTIVDAIRAIVANQESPGEYDLTNFPQWSWRQVYEYESDRYCRVFSPRIAAEPKQHQGLDKFIASARGMVSSRLRTPFVRRTLDRLLTMAPTEMNARAQATWYKLRARNEIDAMTREAIPAAELSWIDLCRRPLRTLQPTAQLLASDSHSDLLARDAKRWPRNLEHSMAAEVGAPPQPRGV
jgi:nucleoside-diphosphate-sugar epimerase